MRSRSQERRRSVGRGTCGPGIQPRKELTPGRRRCKEMRKAPSDAPISRGVPESRAVRDPVHEAGFGIARCRGGARTAASFGIACGVSSLAGCLCLLSVIPIPCAVWALLAKVRAGCGKPARPDPWRCYLRYCLVSTLALLQASCRRIDRVADGFAGYEKFHSPVLLPAGGVTVGGYRQGVAEAFCAD